MKFSPDDRFYFPPPPPPRLRPPDVTQAKLPSAEEQPDSGAESMNILKGE